jgi:hypothetical protein
VTATVAVRTGPAAAAIERSAATVSGRDEAEAWITASAPTSRQDCATWPRCTASPSMVPNATTARARTSANTGTTALAEVRVARASPTSALTPGRALASRRPSRSTAG